MCPQHAGMSYVGEGRLHTPSCPTDHLCSYLQHRSVSCLSPVLPWTIADDVCNKSHLNLRVEHQEVMMIWASGGDDDLSTGGDYLNIRWWWSEHQVVMMIWASGGDVDLSIRWWWWSEHQVVIIWTSGDDQIIWASGDDYLSIRWAPVVIMRWWCNHCDLSEHRVMMNAMKHQINRHIYISHTYNTQHHTQHITHTSHAYITHIYHSQTTHHT